jgi:formylglycine-generating enzyme required for sulfatase activity
MNGLVKLQNVIGSQRFGLAVAVAVVTIGQAAQAIVVPVVRIGNVGNQADQRYIDSYHPNGVGSVAQPFNIGKTEVTNAQYVEFLNAVAAADPYGLYDSNMGSLAWGGIVRFGQSGGYFYRLKTPALGGAYKYDDKPVVYVNSGDAMRFANWLYHNQPTGSQDASTTEDGAYPLNGAVTDATLAAVTRNSGASWWLPSESEWYKAAYYDPSLGIFYDYPTGTNSIPNNNLPSADTGNSANCYNTTGDNAYSLTDVGAYTNSESPYGTFDQGGSVWEWTETKFAGAGGTRGGSFRYNASWLHASGLNRLNPTTQYSDVGFRVASMAVPGDYSGNGAADAADYVMWRKNPGSMYVPGDYDIWRMHFGQAALSTASAAMTGMTAISEPASHSLAVFVVGWMIDCRQRRPNMRRPR